MIFLFLGLLCQLAIGFKLEMRDQMSMSRVVNRGFFGGSVGTH